MRGFVIILLMLISAIGYAQEAQIGANELISQNEAEALFLEANKAYEQSEYDTAILIYDRLEASGLISWELYYNKANSFYKLNDIAYAIINYERALRLSPNNNDIAFNLRLANTKTVDKVDAIPRLFILIEFGLAEGNKDYSVLLIQCIT